MGRLSENVRIISFKHLWQMSISKYWIKYTNKWGMISNVRQGFGWSMKIFCRMSSRNGKKISKRKNNPTLSTPPILRFKIRSSIFFTNNCLVSWNISKLQFNNTISCFYYNFLDVCLNFNLKIIRYNRLCTTAQPFRSMNLDTASLDTEVRV